MTWADDAGLICRIRRDSEQYLAVDVFDPESTAYPIEGDSPEVGSYVIGQLGEGRVRVLDTLAEAGTARAEVFAIAIQHGLDPRFPPEVMAEVAELVASPGIDDPELVDRRALARWAECHRVGQSATHPLVKPILDEMERDRVG